MTRIFVVLATILLATSAGAASTTSMNVDITVTHAGSPVQTLIPVIQPAGTVFQFLAGAGSANTSLGTIVQQSTRFARMWRIVFNPSLSSLNARKSIELLFRAFRPNHNNQTATRVRRTNLEGGAIFYCC